MAEQNTKPVMMENVEMIFTNFVGAAGKYNREGSRHFSIKLDTEVAEAMEKDGWNVRWLQPRDEHDEPQAILEIAINFEGRIPPQVTLITSRGKTRLDEDTISMLDWAEVSNVDLTFNPYHWDVNGNTGVKAYLRSLWVTIVEDDLEKKYYDVPDTAAGGFEYEGGPSEEEDR